MAEVREQTHAAVGRRQVLRGGITPVIANMLGATLVPGWRPEMAAEGAVLPLLWHWAGFHPDAAMEEIGADGHPRLGRFLPDLGLGRRMWAGGKLTFLRPLHVGEPLEQRSHLASLERKEASSGLMALVTVTHEIHGADGLAIEEVQNIVYLPIPDAYRPPKRQPVPEAPIFDEAVEIDTVRLFRYSAATFNAHRIHFDRDYATKVEHYPGLVVHGPMQATLLIAAAERHRGARPTSFRYRGVHPMLDTHGLRLIGAEAEGGGWQLCTAAPDGYQGTAAMAEWA